MNDFAQVARELAENNCRMVKVGMTSVEERFRPAIQLLEREYLASLVDSNTKMATRLQLAILQVIGLLPSNITERVNDYANTKIKADQLARHEGRPDHDMTTDGRKVA